MPASLKQALADPLVLGHPDVPWTLPAELPPARDLTRGILVLEKLLLPVDRKHAAYCMGKLASGFNERLTDREAEIRVEVWLEVAGHVPNDLWSTATIELLKTWRRDTHFGRVPEAADLLAQVSDRLAKRRQDLERCQAMKRAEPPPAPKEQPLPRGLDRLRHSRAIYEKLGRTADVERIDRMIAGKSDINPQSEVGIPTSDPPLSPAMQARTKLSLARSWRDQGNEERARQLEAEAREIAPQMFEERRDVAEARHG